MRSRKYTSSGIILARHDYSDADRILVVFTKDFGKISLLAKGIKRPKSKKRGSVEIFAAIRFSAVRGKGMDIMTEAEEIESFEGIRTDLRKISIAYYFIEVVNKLTRDGEPNEELYDFLVDSFSRLKSTKNLAALRKEFVYHIMVIMGYWPFGKELLDPDGELEKVTERKLSSVRVGKKVLQ